VDEDFSPVYGQHPCLTFNTMGLRRNYQTGDQHAKPAWWNWLAGVNK
jgi:hypothetical protein